MADNRKPEGIPHPRIPNHQPYETGRFTLHLLDKSGYLGRALWLDTATGVIRLVQVPPDERIALGGQLVSPLED